MLCVCLSSSNPLLYLADLLNPLGILDDLLILKSPIDTMLDSRLYRKWMRLDIPSDIRVWSDHSKVFC